jgi:predicted kinase
MVSINLLDKLRSYWTSWANGNVNSVPTIIETCPELQLMFDTPQSKSDHAEGNVARHTILTCEAANQLAQGLPSNIQKMLRLAAILHDVGKPHCFKEIAPGIYSFENAHLISSRLSRVILDKYTQINPKERESILALINNHPVPIWSVKNDMPLREIYKTSLECNLKVLYLLTKSNYIGRQAPNLRERFEELETFKYWCQNKGLWEDKSWPGLLNYSFFRRFGQNAETAKSIIDWFYLTGKIIDKIEAQEWLRNKNRQWHWGNLFLTVGPPGAGKSSWIEKNYSMYPVISSDQIRIELTGDIANQDMNNEVFKIAHERLYKYLEQGKKVVFDATNLKASDRKISIDIARENGASVNVLFFTTKYDNCLARVKTRHILPLTREILDEKYANFDYVAPYEFDKIYYI